MFFDFIIEYTDIFCVKNHRSFCDSDIYVRNFNETLTKDVVSFEQPGTEKLRSLFMFTFISIKKLTKDLI